MFHETGEIKRVVSFLLIQLDQLPSYVITAARRTMLSFSTEPSGDASSCGSTCRRRTQPGAPF